MREERKRYRGSEKKKKDKTTIASLFVLQSYIHVKYISLYYTDIERLDLKKFRWQCKNTNLLCQWLQQRENFSSGWHRSICIDTHMHFYVMSVGQKERIHLLWNNKNRTQKYWHIYIRYICPSKCFSIHLIHLLLHFSDKTFTSSIKAEQNLVFLVFFF